MNVKSALNFSTHEKFYQASVILKEFDFITSFKSLKLLRNMKLIKTTMFMKFIIQICCTENCNEPDLQRLNIVMDVKP